MFNKKLKEEIKYLADLVKSLDDKFWKLSRGVLNKDNAEKLATEYSALKADKTSVIWRPDDNVFWFYNGGGFAGNFSFDVVLQLVNDLKAEKYDKCKVKCEE